MDLRDHGRILYVSSVDVSIGNGPGVNEREFILELSRLLGDRTHFLIPQPESEEVPDLPEGQVSFCRSHHRHNPRYFPGHVASQVRMAKRILAQQDFDLLIFRLDVLPLAPFVITRGSRIPFALKTLGQGMINVLGERGGWIGKTLMGINHRLVSRLVSRAIVADSVSVLQVEQIQDTFGLDPDKIVWIDNAVNTDRFHPVPTSEARAAVDLSRFDPIAGYVGTRPWERGGLQLIESAPHLLKKHPGLGIIILGDGKEIDGLKTRALELGVQDHCRFTGYVPFHKVPLFVNSLDVGVSISVRSDREAAAELKVRQYLACGKPVIVSPGSNEFVSEHSLGSIVRPADEAAIANELDRWLSLDNAGRADFRSRAARYARNHLSMTTAVTRRLDLWGERLHQSQADAEVSGREQ
jgi:glycosyltransferase involved in cell wall biosynthesis